MQEDQGWQRHGLESIPLMDLGLQVFRLHADNSDLGGYGFLGAAVIDIVVATTTVQAEVLCSSSLFFLECQFSDAHCV